MNWDDSDTNAFISILNKAIKQTSFAKKTDVELIGDIYTRMRSDIIYGKHNRLKLLLGRNKRDMMYKLPNKLKQLFYTSINNHSYKITETDCLDINLGCMGYLVEQFSLITQQLSRE